MLSRVRRNYDIFRWFSYDQLQFSYIAVKVFLSHSSCQLNAKTEKSRKPNVNIFEYNHLSVA